MFIGQMGRLEEIKDDNNIYCIFSYNDNISTDIQLYPGTAEQKNLKIRFSNNYISSIEDLSLNTPLEWRFQYTQVDSFYLLSGLTCPTGLVDTVNYTSGIMRFPTSAGFPPPTSSNQSDYQARIWTTDIDCSLRILNHKLSGIWNK